MSPASGFQAKTCNKFDQTRPFGGDKESGIGREGGMQGLAKGSARGGQAQQKRNI